MKIALALKPLSVNALFQGRRYKTKEYKQYQKDVFWLLDQQGVESTVDGFVDIHYRFHLKNWKRTDGDNLVKGLQDILVKYGCIEDDRKIIRYVIEKIPAEENWIEIEITKHSLAGT